ncbi:hypothetical protein ACFVFQ_06175 [Streptomyces sp. NPDC057743]
MLDRPTKAMVGRWMEDDGGARWRGNALAAYLDRHADRQLVHG